MSIQGKSESVSGSKLASSSALLRCSDGGGMIREALIYASNTKAASPCSISVFESLAITCSSSQLIRLFQTYFVMTKD